jgi:hypothetical protein
MTFQRTPEVTGSNGKATNAGLRRRFRAAKNDAFPMELLAFIVEALLWLVDLFLMGADVYSWLKGKPNRVERKEAKQAGAKPPPRDKWNHRVIVLTIIACLLTIVLLTVRSKLW